MMKPEPVATTVKSVAIRQRCYLGVYPVRSSGEPPLYLNQYVKISGFILVEVRVRLK